MSTTSIEWATHVWNPVIGCDRVSPGCAHCYALELAPRLRAMQQARGQADGAWATQADGGPASGPAFAVRVLEDRLDQPLAWRTPRPRVFANSMGDLFHEDVRVDAIARVLARMAAARSHNFLVLTKRAGRMRELVAGDQLRDLVGVVCAQWLNTAAPAWPLPNLWLGVSIENRRYVSRADDLRATPAAVRFVSAEPLLGPLIAPHHLAVPEPCSDDPDEMTVVPWWDDVDRVGNLPELDLTDIDWLIAGGESGPRHRTIKAEWVRDLRDACGHAGTAFFFKQWGGRTPKAGGRDLDGRTWDQLPAVTA